LKTMELELSKKQMSKITYEELINLHIEVDN